MKDRLSQRWMVLVAAGVLATGGIARPDSPAGPSAEVRTTTIVAVRGIEGIKGAKLLNLEQALKLQHNPPPPPKSTVAALADLSKPNPAPSPEPAPPTDERKLLEEIPPDALGGS